MKISTIIAFGVFILLAVYLAAHMRSSSATQILTNAQNNLDGVGRRLLLPVSSEGAFGSNVRFTNYPVSTFNVDNLSFSPSDFGA